MKKHFEAFQDFIESSDFKFSANCLSKTWFQPPEISNSNFQLPRYYSFHLTREKNRGGGLYSFFAGNLLIQIQERPPGKTKIENRNPKNIVLNLAYCNNTKQ